MAYRNIIIAVVIIAIFLIFVWQSENLEAAKPGKWFVTSVFGSTWQVKPDTGEEPFKIYFSGPTKETVVMHKTIIEGGSMTTKMNYSKTGPGTIILTNGDKKITIKGADDKLMISMFDGSKLHGPYAMILAQ